MATALFVVAFLLVLEFNGWFAGIEGKFYDTWASPLLERFKKLEPGPVPAPSPQVVVVDIDDASYHRCFAGTSPLNPRKVQALVKEVRDRTGPNNVIAVDLLTE